MGRSYRSIWLHAWLLLAMITPSVHAQVSFLSTPFFPVGNQPRSAAGGDFNGDGNADVVTANEGDDTVSVLISNGDGTFQPPVFYPVGAGSGPYAVAVADFNGDGKLDLVVTLPNKNAVGILLGNGDGTFQPAVNYATGGGGYRIVVADFNGDGKPDLGVSLPFGNAIVILLGKGDGTFPSFQGFSVPGPFALAAGDFNGDGKPDLIVSNSSDSMLSVFLGKGDGSFAAGATYVAMSSHYGIAVADLNHDGKLDLALSDDGPGAVDVMLGKGDGTFAAPVSYGVAAHGVDVAVVDLNHDGNPDLAVADSGTNSIRLLPGSGDGTFHGSTQYAMGPSPIRLVAADFNRDGKIDLACVNYSGNNVSILIGNCDGTLVGARAYDLPNLFGIAARGVALGDLNGDGKVDVALSDGPITLMLGNGDGTLQSAVTVANSDGLATAGIAIADFNLDGKFDLAAATGMNIGGQKQAIAVQLGNGDGTFQSELDFSGGPGPHPLAVADLNRDGKLDLVAGNHDGFVTLLGDGTGNFSSLGTTVTGFPGDIVAIDDFNHDGKPDVVVADGSPFGGPNVRIFLGNGDGTFLSVPFPYSFTTLVGVAVGDFNSDGVADLAIATVTTPGPYASVNILLGNGDGSFRAPVSYPAGTSAQAIAVADLDRDGHLDLVVGSGPSGVEVLRGNGDGTFQPPLNFGGSFFNGLNAMAVGDLNGDGLPDVVLASSSDSVTVLLNQGTSRLRGTKTTLTSSPNPAVVGQSVTLTATVAGLVDSSGTPTGTVAFMKGKKVLGSGTLNRGTASFTTSMLPAGANYIKAVYGGDSNFVGSISKALKQVVNKATTTTTLASSQNPSKLSQPVTFTATVTPQYGGTVTGTVTFYDGTTVLRTVSVSAGVAKFTTSTLTSGKHTIKATYNGSANFTGSSTSLTQTVN